MPLEFPNSPANGALNQQFQYDASITAWRNQGSTQNVGTAIAALQASDGLKPVIPTSVALTTSGTYSIATNGLVTFSGAAGFRVNGIFSSAYKKYILEFDLIHATATEIDSFYVLTKPSDVTPNLTSGLYNFSQARYAGVSTAVGIQAGYNGNYVVGPTFGNQSYGTATIHVNNPFDSTIYTSGYTHFAGTAPAQSGYLWTGTSGFNHRSLESSDGFYILPNGGTFSGTLRIYGYN